MFLVWLRFRTRKNGIILTKSRVNFIKPKHLKWVSIFLTTLYNLVCYKFNFFHFHNIFTATSWFLKQKTFFNSIFACFRHWTKEIVVTLYIYLWFGSNIVYNCIFTKIIFNFSVRKHFPNYMKWMFASNMTKSVKILNFFQILHNARRKIMAKVTITKDHVWFCCDNTCQDTLKFNQNGTASTLEKGDTISRLFICTASKIPFHLNWHNIEIIQKHLFFFFSTTNWLV